MRVLTVYLGCRVNRVESDALLAALLAAGCSKSEGNPDVVIVNTCTVTGEAEKKTRKAVHRALREYPQATVLVTGCAAAISPEGFSAMSPRVRVVAKNAVLEAALALREDELHGCADVALPANGAALRYGEDFPTRAGIKIQDGCNNACTYCIVHVARGKSVSRPLGECLSEARQLYAAGAREMVLTGIDLGCYNDGGQRLDGLLRRLLQVAPKARFRISSIEPPSVSQALIDLMAESEGRICRHLHLPLQSGSSKVLAEMGRRYDAGFYRSLVQRLYAAMPGLSLTTDIIVGFPGETQADFQETLDMLEFCRFSKVHIFRYSKRAGTPAAARQDQVDAQISAQRAKQLERAAAAMREKQQLARVGTSEYLVVEQPGLATTESYFSVRVGPNLPRGTICRATLTELQEDGIFAL